jgi:hypothetical protein
MPDLEHEHTEGFWERRLLAAEAAIVFARKVREHHARRTGKGTPGREADLASAMERIREAMAPIRSALGAIPYMEEFDTDLEADLRETSQKLQAERRRIWKMQKR